MTVPILRVSLWPKRLCSAVNKEESGTQRQPRLGRLSFSVVRTDGRTVRRFHLSRCHTTTSRRRSQYGEFRDLFLPLSSLGREAVKRNLYVSISDRGKVPDNTHNPTISLDATLLRVAPLRAVFSQPNNFPLQRGCCLLAMYSLRT